MKKFFWLKSFFAGIASTILGAVSNLVTLYVNGNMMPVHGFIGCTPGSVIDTRHVCASSIDHLSILTDRVSAMGVIFSAGDLAMFFGIALMATSFFFLVYCLVVERI